MLAALAAASCLAPVRPTAAILISWDGAPHWVVSRLAAEGKLPNVRRLIERGWMAEGLRPAMPSKTAVSHAAIFTGAWGTVSGITNNAVQPLPRSTTAITESFRGFDSRALLAEPIFITAAKAGLDVAALSATQTFPPETHTAALRRAGTPPGRYLNWSGFENVFTRGVTFPSSRWTDTALTFRIGDTEIRATGSEEAVEISAGGRTERIKAAPPADLPTEWAGPFTVRKDGLRANAWFRCFQTAKGAVLYVREAAGLVGSGTPEQTEEYIDAYGGFHDDPWTPYGRGDLGPRLWEGGDGRAERAVLEALALDMEFCRRSFDWGWARRPGFMTLYTPNSDSAGHTWIGLLDPASPRYDPAVAARLWPIYEEVFRQQDAWLGHMMEAAGPEAAFCLVSDHGMEGVGARIHTNQVLAEAGLLAWDDQGRIDPARTRAAVWPWNFNAIGVHTVDWKGGIVPLEEREAVVEAAERALLNARSPDGRPLFRMVFRPEEVEAMGAGGPRGADLYYDTAPGYDESPARAEGFTSEMERDGLGVHGAWPLRPKLQGIWIMGGAGVRAGAVVRGARAIDVAPTLSELMSIPAPAQATGLPMLAGLAR
jgi:predicted AlkP superfamily phosphohydrolase/phosphomutase